MREKDKEKEEKRGSTNEGTVWENETEMAEMNTGNRAEEKQDGEKVKLKAMSGKMELKSEKVKVGRFKGK